MRIQMPWFPPLGFLAGAAGVQTARHLFRAGGPRHRIEAFLLVLMSWFPLFVWCLVQLPGVSR
jgi:hypothetical protein